MVCQGLFGKELLRSARGTARDTEAQYFTPRSCLVAHVEEGAQGEAEGVGLVVADEVAHVLQQEVARAVEVGVRQVRHHHAVLHQAPHACTWGHTPLIMPWK